VFVAVALPVLIAVCVHFIGTTGPTGHKGTGSEELRLLDTAISSGVIVVPEEDYEEIKRIVRAQDDQGPTSGRLAWPPVAEDLTSLGLPRSAYEQLTTQGYAFGDVELGNHEGPRFAVWRVPEGEGTGVEPESFSLVIGTAQDLHGQLIELAVIILLFCLLTAAIAFPAAWYLERRIVWPVRRVAEASRVVAEGGHPMPVPRKGPVELIALSDSFNDMAAKLEKAQAAERQFLLSVSHELKTPLTAIDGYAELLTEGAVDGEQAGLVLTSEAGRLRRLVSDLLDLAKLSQSTFTIREEQVDLDAVAGEVVRRHAARAKELGVQLLALSSGAAARVRGDEDRVVQAVSNLVENALGCVPGGGLVTVETGLGEVIVRDDGPGLAAGDLPHAFERFYLHDRMKSDRDLGTGLGLALVKELVERMGGEVSVASEPGKGAVFSLKLQMSRAANAWDVGAALRGDR
jgi:signal transduction histidine kinase